MKKLAVVLSICLICSLLLTSCGKPTDEGAFLDVDIKDGETESPFTKLDSPLDYEYRLVENKRACMRYEVPKDWEVSVKNARHIIFEAPEDDPYLPGMTLHCYNSYYATEDSFNFDTVGSYDTYFQNDLPLTAYNFGSDDYMRFGMTTPDEAITNTDFTSGDETLTSIQYWSSPTLLKSSTHDVLKTDAAICAYYVKWYDIPTVFTCAFEDSKKDTAYQLLDYIVSSMQHISPSLNGDMIKAEFDGIEIELPSNFKKTKENTYEVPITDLSQYSGFSVIVYDVDDDSQNQFENNLLAFCETYIENAVQISTTGHYEVMPSLGTDTEELSSSRNHLKRYCYTILRSLGPNQEHIKTWNDYYNGDNCLYTTYYYYDAPSDDKVIAFTWSAKKVTEAIQIEKNIEISMK